MAGHWKTNQSSLKWGLFLLPSQFLRAKAAYTTNCSLKACLSRGIFPWSSARDVLGDMEQHFSLWSINISDLAMRTRRSFTTGPTLWPQQTNRAPWIQLRVKAHSSSTTSGCSQEGRALRAVRWMCAGSHRHPPTPTALGVLLCRGRGAHGWDLHHTHTWAEGQWYYPATMCPTQSFGFYSPRLHSCQSSRQQPWKGSALFLHLRQMCWERILQ